MRRVHMLAALGAAASLALAGCGQAPTSTPGQPDEAGATDTAASDFKACMVSDSGGFDDKSFNQAAYSGLTSAKSSLGIETAEAESQSDSDFAPNIDAMVQQGCDITIGAGYLLEDAIQSAAEANPEAHFAIVDSVFQDENFQPIVIPNGKPILFNTGEAAFLAGYLAAGMTKTGTVGTYGGLPLPSVNIFMDGFSDGIDKYNEDNDTKVKLVGWDKESQKGSFAGTFQETAQGAAIGEALIAQGADIILPVAGPVGEGTAGVAEGKDVLLIWPDADGYETTEFGDIILTSVLKHMGPAVEGAIAETVKGEFDNTAFVGTMANDGVSLAPYHDFDSEVPQELKDKIEDYKKQIIDGTLVLESVNQNWKN